MQKANTMQKEDVWLHSTCVMCHNECGILVHRVDGVVVDVKGDPDHPKCLGKLCAKGYSTIMSLYDPHRVKTPLKRTNPQKGLGVDPGWTPISWDEALDILEEKLTKIRKEDPRKLSLANFGGGADHETWAKAFGTPNWYWQGYFCGNYLHSSMFLTNGTFHCDFDVEHCNYVILLGNQQGFGAGIQPNIAIQKVAKARKRGMKVVAVDPLCTPAASKADEWLPVRPGTDGALVFSIINVLLNELGIYDREFIKKHTNGPYLVKPDGYYPRREGKPLVWDAEEGTTKTWDADVKDYAIEGSYMVDGVECHPAFQLVKEHGMKYTPEMAAEITTIPATQIRRVAEEFGKAARIGSTIMVDGVELPYRPAAINIYRGAGSHKHGVAVALAVSLLNQIVGNYYVPGGHRGTDIVGPSWKWKPRQSSDGLIVKALGTRHEAEYYEFKVEAPQRQDLKELFPISTNWSAMNQITLAEPEKYKLPYKPEVLFTCNRNLFLSGANHEMTAEALKKYRFIAVFGNYLDEMAQIADLFLPTASGREDLSLQTGDATWGGRGITGYWHWGIRQPMAPPPGEARSWADVLMELAERMGFLGRYYELVNSEVRGDTLDSLGGTYKLDISKKYSWEEIWDRKAKSKFGEEKGLEWFKHNGGFSVKQTVDEIYPLPQIKARFPMYFENLLRAGREVQKVTQSMGLKDWDVSDYTALPDWKPCASYHRVGDFDLIAFNFRLATHSFSWSAENPWLCELAELNPYAQRIIINTKAARRKGIRDKDRVCVESAVGKVFGIAKVTECVHPEAVGISGHFGSLASGKPVAYGKGANQNDLLPLSLKEIDPVSTGLDACVAVKVYKV